MDLTKIYIKETGLKPMLIESDSNLGYTFEYTVWLQEKLEKLLTIPDVSDTLTAGDVERINKTPIWNFLDWLTDNNKIGKKSLLWDHMNTYIKGVIERFKEAEKVNGR